MLCMQTQNMEQWVDSQLLNQTAPSILITTFSHFKKYIAKIFTSGLLTIIEEGYILSQTKYQKIIEV